MFEVLALEFGDDLGRARVPVAHAHENFKRSVGGQCLRQRPGLALGVFQQRRFAAERGITLRGLGCTACGHKPGE